MAECETRKRCEELAEACEELAKRAERLSFPMGQAVRNAAANLYDAAVMPTGKKGGAR